jgi:hypothetical protein
LRAAFFAAWRAGFLIEEVLGDGFFMRKAWWLHYAKYSLADHPLFIKLALRDGRAGIEAAC